MFMLALSRTFAFAYRKVLQIVQATERKVAGLPRLMEYPGDAGTADLDIQRLVHRRAQRVSHRDGLRVRRHGRRVDEPEGRGPADVALAILGQLDATANWRRIAEELWPWVHGEPSTPLGEAEAAWRADRAARADGVAATDGVELGDLDDLDDLDDRAGTA